MSSQGDNPQKVFALRENERTLVAGWTTPGLHQGQSKNVSGGTGGLQGELTDHLRRETAESPRASPDMGRVISDSSMAAHRYTAVASVGCSGSIEAVGASGLGDRGPGVGALSPDS